MPRVSHFHKRYSSIMFIYFLGNAVKCRVKTNISLKLNITVLHYVAFTDLRASFDYHSSKKSRI